MLVDSLVNRFFGLLGLVCLAAIISGCGGRSDLPPLGEVAGTVTFNGQPVSDVTIQFTPEAGGRTSAGITDQSGHYWLLYTSDTAGAQVGKHTARLVPSANAASDSQMDLTTPQTSIPADLMQRTFDFEVVSGKNTFDLTLP